MFIADANRKGRKEKARKNAGIPEFFEIDDKQKSPFKG